LPRPTRLLGHVLLAALPAVLAAQRRQLALYVGHSYGDNPANTYDFRVTVPLAGVFAYGFSASAAISDTLGRRRAFYGLGYELQAGRRGAALRPYGLAGVALGLSTDTTTQELALQWSLGGGVEWQPAAWLGAGIELRYRLEDRGPRGFWRTDVGARHGVGAAVGISLGLGKRKGARRRASHEERLPVEPPVAITGSAADVVQSALGALGTPYQWGGSADNGFDCSGLIQYAYGLHGIRLPRRSREQAQAGAEVPPVVEALRPGDLLLFSISPGSGVTHVGMYVGEGKFIHSATDGVKLSRLELRDPDGEYWIARWVGVRRIIP
jgi:cell wall-associated NlpC family hydrolase